MKHIKDLLKKPSRESQPWAMWIWNLRLSQSQLSDQFNWFVANGFGGIIIRPSRNMVPEYLSEEFIDLFSFILRNARKHGIGIRLADDFSLPWNGCFSDELIQSTRMRAQHLRLVENRTVELGEEIVLAKKEYEKGIILCVNYKNGMIEPSTVRELTGIASSEIIKWQVPEGEWKLMIFRKEYITDPTGSYIPNVFNPKSASAYFQHVLDLFKGHFSRQMPSTFEGFITELPSCRPCDNTIPWDDDLVVKFRSKSKKNMIKLLPALFCEHFPAAQKNRQQIYSFIFQSMYERFVAPLEAWAKKNRLSQWVLSPERSIYSTNTVLADGYIPPETDLGAVGYQNIDGVLDNFALLRIMADANTNEFRRETITVIGRNRTGAGLTIQDLKRDVDTVLLSGPTRIIIDGFFVNLDQRSYAKTPFNTGWYTPGNENMGKLCAYISRSQEIIKNVHWNRQVAVLAPTSEIMSAYIPENGESSTIGLERLEKTIHALERCGISYDLVSEALLTNCSVRSNGEFGTADRIRKGNYQALIVPYAPDISRNVLIFIEKMVQKEGCVYFIEEAPRGTIEDGVSPTMSSRIERILAERHKKTGLIQIDSLDESFNDLVPHIRILVNGKTGSDIYHACGIKDGNDIYLFHNFSDTREHAAVLELPKSKHFTLIDCERGEMVEIPPVKQIEGVCSFKFNAYPKSTSILVSSTSSLTHGSSKEQCNPFLIPERGYRIVLKNHWEFSTCSLNALPLSNWNVRIGLSRESGGFSHFYEAHFQAKSVPSLCNLVLNSPGILGIDADKSEFPIEVTVNGSRVDPLQDTPPEEEMPDDDQNGEPFVESIVFDESVLDVFRTSSLIFSIRDHLVRGFNRIAIRTTGQILDPCTVHYPPLVFGDFILVKGQNGWAVEKLTGCFGANSWIKCGFPYLCGRGVYQQSFEIPNDYKKLILRFSEVSGTVDLVLNGKDLGVFNWQPMEIDITSVCEPKRNELVIGVVNSIDTLLRMNGRPSGLIGDVYLDVY